jgi:hypothetical protein
MGMNVAGRDVQQLALVPSPGSCASVATRSQQMQQSRAATKLRALSNASSSASTALAAGMAAGGMFEAQVQQRQEVGQCTGTHCVAI